MFRIRVFFSRIRVVELFFMSPYPDWLKIRILVGKIRILVGKIRIHEKNVLTESTSRRFVYFIFSTLNTVLFGQVPPKPNQKHHLDYWFANGRIRVFNVQIRIRNTVCNPSRFCNFWHLLA